VTIPTSNTTPSQLPAHVEAGEEIVPARGKEPSAKPVALKSPPSKRQFGALRGMISVGPEPFDPLPEQELEKWE